MTATELVVEPAGKDDTNEVSDIAAQAPWTERRVLDALATYHRRVQGISVPWTWHEQVPITPARNWKPAPSLLEGLSESTVRIVLAGVTQSRILDGLAIHRWPSRKYERVAFEVKVSRSDWLRELADPTKRLAALSFAHRWVVAAPVGIVRADELPAGAGWVEVHADGRLRTRRKGRLTSPAPLHPESLLPFAIGWSDATARLAAASEDEDLEATLATERQELRRARARLQARDADIARLKREQTAADRRYQWLYQQAYFISLGATDIATTCNVCSEPIEVGAWAYAPRPGTSLTLPAGTTTVCSRCAHGVERSSRR